MIIDLERFIHTEKPYWDELEAVLAKRESDVAFRMDLDGVKRFHYLYQRVSTGLARIGGHAAEAELALYLEALVARAFAEIHEGDRRPSAFSPRAWFLGAFPRAFRRHIRAFWLAVAVTIAGCAFGAGALVLDPSNKEILLPFEHLQMSPSERVAKEEREVNRDIGERKLTFSSYLMTHNIRVAMACMALGVSFGIGTLLLLFYNGVIIGAVALDFVAAGKTAFLVGWLLPHGAVEIPAIIIAGQGGFVLARALIGRESGISLGERLRGVHTDLIALISGVAAMLFWAGIIEALFSQYHEPVLPYSLKIGFGVTELAVLAAFLGMAGAGGKTKREPYCA